MGAARRTMEWGDRCWIPRDGWRQRLRHRRGIPRCESCAGAAGLHVDGSDTSSARRGPLVGERGSALGVSSRSKQLALDGHVKQCARDAVLRKAGVRANGQNGTISQRPRRPRIRNVAGRFVKDVPFLLTFVLRSAPSVLNLSCFRLLNLELFDSCELRSLSLGRLVVPSCVRRVQWTDGLFP